MRTTLKSEMYRISTRAGRVFDKLRKGFRRKTSNDHTILEFKSFERAKEFFSRHSRHL